MVDYQNNQSGGAWKKWAIGCSATSAIFIIAIMILVSVVKKNARNWGADFAEAGIVAVIDDSELSDADKQGMKLHVKRLTEGFKSGQITLEQLGAVADELAQRPLMHVGMVYFVQQGIVDPSKLSDDEKKQAKLDLQRYARGIYEETIDADSMETVADPIMTTDATGEKVLKENPTAEEIKLFLANVKKAADEAKIANEPYEIDLVKEFADVIDRGLDQTQS